MTTDEAVQLLEDSGFDTGWAVCEGQLVLWEHIEDPPPPLVRPEPIEP